MITIIKKGVGSATHRVESAREVHDPHSRKEFSKYKDMEAVLNGAEVDSFVPSGINVAPGRYKPIDRIQDINMYSANMRKNKANYERGCPIPLTPDIRNALWRKAKLLKNKIEIGMLSNDELHPVKVKQIIVNDKVKMATVVDYSELKRTKAVDRNIVWHKRNEGHMKEFKRIMRVLEPDDKNITKVVENWRPKKRKA